jgi:type IV pilus assembly protein PilM
LVFAKPKRAIGLDIGTHSVKAVQMSRSGGRLCIDEVGYELIDRNQVNQDPVMAHANAVRESLRNLQVPQCLIVSAMTGQTAVIRYPRLAGTPRDQLAAAVEREAGQNIPYDLGEVFLDWALLDEVEEGGEQQFKVLLVAAKHEAIDARLQILESAEVACGVLSVDSLALADAAEACDFVRVGETVALLNIGLSSASIHFVKDGISNFIRDVNWGGRELIQAIAKDRRCDFEEAEKILQEIVFDAPDENAGAEQEPEPTPDPEPQPEAAPPAPDPFGGSLLDPLDDELGGLGDPLGGPPAPAAPQGGGLGGGDDGGEPDPREALAAPLSRMVAEIRRSFDFYEHQLYERPVDRIILSGGVARLPLVGQTLVEELGVESVELADPMESGLLVGNPAATANMAEHPAQFMVAVGLAARGMAEL